jgi:hypothetical protein
VPRRPEKKRPNKPRPTQPDLPAMSPPEPPGTARVFPMKSHVRVQRDRHRVGAHALARDAAGGVGGAEEGQTRPIMNSQKGL